MQSIGHITYLVRDYDEAIAWFKHALQFVVIEDTKLSETKRWVLVAPVEKDSPSLLLAQATTPQQQTQIGNQSGGRVFLFLYTDNLTRDYETMKSRGVQFIEEPRNETYGTVAVFLDLYGNKWDLLEHR